MEENNSFFASNKIIAWLSIILIFGAGLAIRMYDLFDYPLDFHATRQLHSMLMARGMYYQDAENIPDWKRDMAVQQWKVEGVIEPPIMEWLTAQGYRLAGSDDVWIARLLSIFFWISGGIALFLLARDITGYDGAIISIIFYLFLPYAGVASRSFQPDPMMTALTSIALWGMNRFYRSQTWKWAILAGLLGGLAIFSKAVAVFFVGGGWVGLIGLGMAMEASSAGGDGSIRKWISGLFRVLKNPKIWVIAILTVLPYLSYHVYGVYINGFLGSQMSLRFFPNLWLDPVWYLRWKGQISSTVRFEWFILAILSTFLFKNFVHRMMMLGIWIGYFLYGMTLSYHIATHDYYQLPLIPVVALALAAGTESVFRNMHGPKKILSALAAGIVLFTLVVNAWDIRVDLKRMDYKEEVKFWETLGKKLSGASVIGLTQDYGYRLAYWGWVNSTNWMYGGDFAYRELAGQEFNDIQELFEERIAGKDYFVVTMFNELDSQPLVKDLLYKNFSILEQGDDYVIFDLHNKIPAADTIQEQTKE